MNVKKAYHADGRVAVLVTSDYGAGWYTWNREYPAIAFDKDIVDAVLAGDRLKAQEIAQRKYGEGIYGGGARNLTVVWVQPGAKFIITEYDGLETLTYLDNVDILEA